jgi:hypothetical protein
VEELNHANIFMFKGSSYTSKLVISIWMMLERLSYMDWELMIFLEVKVRYKYGFGHVIIFFSLVFFFCEIWSL